MVMPMDQKMDEENKTQTFNFLINSIMRVVKSANSRKQKLQSICKLLKENIQYYDWVGFYIANESEKELTLGPYIGKPTEHTKIPFGRGICGQAADRKETFIVQDVSKESNYLSCSPLVKSEIVVPIIKNNKVLGELDIDSHVIEPLTKEDIRFLEDVCNIITQLF